MDEGGGGVFSDDPSAAAWDLSELLDFSTDDSLAVPIPWDDDHDQNEILPLPDSTGMIAAPPTDPDTSDPAPSRVRKRDPRLVCSNYLAGRVPCACPEVDEKAMEDEEEEERVGVVVTAGKKRARRVGSRERDAVVRCQVEGCGSDIRELKGYHQRHRVCLRCANAAVVVVDGESKRYCQQCGKFHILSNFDEGKRSCRRKLEHHNERRRRKLPGSRVQAGKELPRDVHPMGDGCGDDVGKDSLCISNPSDEKETLFDHDDGRISAPSTAPESQSVPTDSVISFEASHEAQVHNRKDNSKCSVSPSYCDNRSAYSAVCPTGRISFKLYDWNPAEFPRRLRHQIFEWLSSMPVELEGYIRPGCTILTIFIAMPKLMWGKVYEDPALLLHRFILQPGSMLSGKGTIFVNIDDKIFHIVENGNAVVELKMEAPAPRLHYVHPIFFEAGKPIEFVACGSGIFQPKLRFLVSFDGKYLTCDCSPSCPCRQKSGCTNCNCNHQSYKLSIPPTEPTLCGPAFIEVENQSGLSNFVPVLIGDKEVCSEMRLLQQKADESFEGSCQEYPRSVYFPNSCDTFSRTQAMLADFVTDIAWLLKDPAPENVQSFLTSSQIERFISLLDFLMQNDSVVILEKIMQSLKALTDKLSTDLVGSDKINFTLLEAQMDNARDHLNSKCGSSVQHSGCSCSKKWRPQDFSQIDLLSVASKEDKEMTESNNEGNPPHSLIPIQNLEAAPLLDAEPVRNSNLLRRKHSNPTVCSFSSRSRPKIYLIATAAFCLGICAVLLHPNKMGELAVSVHRGLSRSPIC